MSKLLLILVVFAAAANALAAENAGPPLLIESQPAPAPISSLDESR